LYAPAAETPTTATAEAPATRRTNHQNQHSNSTPIILVSIALRETTAPCLAKELA
jgi:hypothetical protein